jgi:hypothetical protein
MMSRWLDAYFPPSAATTGKRLQICPRGEPTKPTKPTPELSFGGFDGFVGSPEPRFAKNSGAELPDRSTEAAERASSIPRGYTRAELEAARLDAQRLGYPVRTVH